MANTIQVKSIERLNTHDRDWLRYEVTVQVTLRDIWTERYNVKPVEMEYVISAWRVGGTKLVAWTIRNENGNLYRGDNGGNGEYYRTIGDAFNRAKRTFELHTMAL